MADVKISQLPVATVPTAADLVPVNQGGTTKTLPASALGGYEGPIVTKTSGATLLLTETNVLADATAASFNLSLPAANTCPGMRYTICKIDNTLNTVTILPTGSDTINSSYPNYPLEYVDEFVQLMSTGTTWRIIAE